MGNCAGGDAKRNKIQLNEAMKALEEMGVEKSRIEDELAKVSIALNDSELGGGKHMAEELDIAHRKNENLRREMEDLESELRRARRSVEEEMEKSRSILNTVETMENANRTALERESQNSANLTNRISELQGQLGFLKQSNSETAMQLQRQMDRSSVSTVEVEKLEQEMEETQRRHDEKKRKLEARIAELTAESEKNKGEIRRLHSEVEEAGLHAEREASVFRASLLETEDEVKRLEKIVGDLEKALRETQEEAAENAVDSRVVPIYDRLQRCLDQISGQEAARSTGNSQISARSSVNNQVNMLQQSHVALQQLKDALEEERQRGLETTELLDQEKVRSQLLLKVIRHFKKKLLLAPSQDSPLTPHEPYTPSAVEAY